jgi:hypothetical protein
LVCCDSYSGFHPQEKDRIYRHMPFCSVSLEEVKANFKAFGISTENVTFVKGYFQDTLTYIPGPIAVLRCDGDTETSTKCILSSLYDKVSSGGFIIIDDFALHECKRGLFDFLKLRNLTPEFRSIDQHSAYWRKP